TADVANPSSDSNQLLEDRFRCTSDVPNLIVQGNLSAQSGYFRLGSKVIWGQCSSGEPAQTFEGCLHDASEHVAVDANSVYLPFDPEQVLDNLRSERYSPTRFGANLLTPTSTVRSMYYRIRPLLGVAVRRYLQRYYFRGWQNIPFPHWPVDRTVEELFEQLL